MTRPFYPIEYKPEEKSDETKQMHAIARRCLSVIEVIINHMESSVLQLPPLDNLIKYVKELEKNNQIVKKTQGISFQLGSIRIDAIEKFDEKDHNFEYKKFFTELESLILGVLPITTRIGDTTVALTKIKDELDVINRKSIKLEKPSPSKIDSLNKNNVNDTAIKERDYILGRIRGTMMDIIPSLRQGEISGNLIMDEMEKLKNVILEVNSFFVLENQERTVNASKQELLAVASLIISLTSIKAVSVKPDIPIEKVFKTLQLKSKELTKMINDFFRVFEKSLISSNPRTVNAGIRDRYQKLASWYKKII